MDRGSRLTFLGALVFCVALGGCAMPVRGADPGAVTVTSPSDAELGRRMRDFLAAFDSISAPEFVAFFPRTGEVHYHHTLHLPHGDSVIARRYAAGEMAAALDFGGSLWESFQLQFEGQPVGLLPDHVFNHPKRWRRIGPARFVPPGADARSPTFVEWRREGGSWVVSAFGDESYDDVLPAGLR